MSISDIRLIVSDLDGTLLGERSAILEENARALRDAAAAGVHIAIASGRLALVCSRMAMEMGLQNCHIIGLNGSHILEKPFGRTVAIHAYSNELRDKCLEILRYEACTFNLYTDKGVVTNQQFDKEEEASFRSHFSNCGCEVVIDHDMGSFPSSALCLKFLIKRTDNLGGYERAKEAIAAISGLYMTSSGANNAEVMLRGAGKGEAVGKLAETLHIPLENVMAFGDFDNDVEMLTKCGLSVAMGNAVDSAKNAARFITLNNTEAGVGYAIQALFSGRLDLLQK